MNMTFYPHLMLTSAQRQQASHTSRHHLRLGFPRLLLVLSATSLAVSCASEADTTDGPSVAESRLEIQQRTTAPPADDAASAPSFELAGSTCPLAGAKQASLRSYYHASTVPTKKIYGVDPDTGASVFLFFTGGCYGVESLPNRSFFLDPNDYDDVKEALDGPGRVNFHGVPTPDPSNPKINNASWQAVP